MRLDNGTTVPPNWYDRGANNTGINLALHRNGATGGVVLNTTPLQGFNYFVHTIVLSVTRAATSLVIGDTEISVLITGIAGDVTVAKLAFVDNTVGVPHVLSLACNIFIRDGDGIKFAYNDNSSTGSCDYQWSFGANQFPIA